MGFLHLMQKVLYLHYKNNKKMAKAVRQNSANTKPAIVAARETIGNSAPTPPEMVTPTVSLEWERTTGPLVKDQAGMLRKIGLIEKGDILGQDLGGSIEAKKKMEEVINKKAGTENTQIGGVDLMSEGKRSAVPFILSGLKDLYDIANKRGIVTRDAFVTNFPELVKGLNNPELKKFMSDPLTFQQMPNLKDVAGEHYSRLKRSFDERMRSTPSTPAPASTTTTAPRIRVRNM